MDTNIDKPSYYNRGRIEVKDFIRDQDLNFNLGSSVKYVCRAGYKDVSKKIEDLKKACNCIMNEVEYLEDMESFKRSKTVRRRVPHGEVDLPY